MKIEPLRFPTVHQIALPLIGATICFGVMWLADYPMEHWHGVVLLWTVSFYASQIVATILIQLISTSFSSSAERVEKVLQSSSQQQPSTISKTVGFIVIVWGLSVLSTILGFAMVVLDMLVHVAELTDLGLAFTYLSLGILAFGVLIQLAMYSCLVPGTQAN